MASLASSPPDLRRTVTTEVERTKQAIVTQHLLHRYSSAQKRLHSRSSFLDTSVALETTPPAPDKSLATGHDQSWAVWKTLNRLRVGEGRCKASMKKWNLTSDACANCTCGEPQTMEHLMNCTQATRCAGNDLAEPTAAGKTDYSDYIVPYCQLFTYS